VKRISHPVRDRVIPPPISRRFAPIPTDEPQTSRRIAQTLQTNHGRFVMHPQVLPPALILLPGQFQWSQRDRDATARWYLARRPFPVQSVFALQRVGRDTSAYHPLSDLIPQTLP